MNDNYSKSGLIEHIQKAVSEIDVLYSQNMVNWSGITSDTREFFTEVIAAELLKDIRVFEKIHRIVREQGYVTPSHFNPTVTVTNRKEEILAKKLMDANLNSLGYILDFQVPIKGKQSDKSGKVDLLSYNNTENVLYLIELKAFKNQETLLRAVLEVYTYYCQIVHQQLIEDFFGSKSKHPLKTIVGDSNLNEIIVKPSVLLTADCKASREYHEIDEPTRKNMKSLINTLDVPVHILNTKYEKL